MIIKIKKLALLNRVDIEILRIIFNLRKATIGQILRGNEETTGLIKFFYHIKLKEKVTESYIYQRISILEHLKLVSRVFHKPLVLKINPDCYNETYEYIKCYLELEKKLKENG